MGAGCIGPAHEVLLDRRYGRMRAATTAPDGALLVTTSNGNADRVIRIARSP